MLRIMNSNALGIMPGTGRRHVFAARVGAVAFAVQVAIALMANSSNPQIVNGVAKSKDGDSLNVGNTEVRLFGVDAPEFDQICSIGGKAWACGSVAADQLSRLVTGREVRCASMGVDQHGRVLGRCTVGTTDINRAMVSLGYAVAYRHYSTDYVSAEESAKLSRRGIWRGQFEMPSDYRHEGDARPAINVSRSPSRSSGNARYNPLRPSVNKSSCNIKGNRGPNGWIYHVPGMPYYEKTRAEQTFCSEADARAAGYRRAKVR